MLKAETFPTPTSSTEPTAVAETDAADFARRYGPCRTDGARCAGCPKLGRRWSCPPFEGDDPFSAALAAMPGARLRLMVFEGDAEGADSATLALEKDGAAAFTAGGCRLCEPADCTRALGEPCRHPERMRPSLQACGLDLTAAARDLLGITLQWGPDAKTIFITGLLIPQNEKS